MIIQVDMKALVQGATTSDLISLQEAISQALAQDRLRAQGIGYFVGENRVRLAKRLRDSDRGWTLAECMRVATIVIPD